MVFILRSLGRLPLWALYRFASFLYLSPFTCSAGGAIWPRATSPPRSRADRCPRARRTSSNTSYRNMADVVVEIALGLRARAAEAAQGPAGHGEPSISCSATSPRAPLGHPAHRACLQLGVAAARRRRRTSEFPITPVYNRFGWRASTPTCATRAAVSEASPIPIKEFASRVAAACRRAPRAYGHGCRPDAPAQGMDKHWTTFLHQDTAFFVGAVKIARFLDAAVV